MTRPPGNPSSASEISRALKKRLGEADRLVSSERFEEAILVYEGLVRDLHAWMLEKTRSGAKPGPSARKALRTIEKRIAAAQRKMAVAERERPTLDLEPFRLRLQNAGTYMENRLLPEAREIYQLLLDQVRSWRQHRTAAPPETLQASRRVVTTLESRLADLQALERYLATGEAVPHASLHERTRQDDHAVFWLAVALSGARVDRKSTRLNSSHYS